MCLKSLVRSVVPGQSSSSPQKNKRNLDLYLRPSISLCVLHSPSQPNGHNGISAKKMGWLTLTFSCGNVAIALGCWVGHNLHIFPFA
jgi:hypothetical protein